MISNLEEKTTADNTVDETAFGVRSVRTHVVAKNSSNFISF